MRRRMILKGLRVLACSVCSIAALSCGGGVPKPKLGGYAAPVEIVVQTGIGECRVRALLPEDDNGDTWFFFHGSGGSAASAYDFAAPILDASVGGFPALVSCSFGPSWFLTDKTDARPVSGTAEFVDLVIPAVEKLVGRDRRTIGFGRSMGGFNLLSVHLYDPGLFDALVFVSPALLAVSPASDPGEISAYVRRTGAYTARQSVMSLFGVSLDRNVMRLLANRAGIAGTPSEWDRIDPLAALSRRGSFPPVPVLVTCGERDEFGLLEGSVRLAEEFRRTGSAVETGFGPGNHSYVPVLRIKEFLSGLNGPGI